MAVSIPIFTAQLRKARVATDLANERAAKAAAVAAALTDDASDASKTSLVYYYDAAAGTVKAKKENITAYGKVNDVVLASNTATGDGFADTTSTDHTGKIVQVTVKNSTINAIEGTEATSDSVKIEWINADKQAATNP